MYNNKYDKRMVDLISPDKTLITLDGRVYPTTEGVRAYLRDDLVGQKIYVGYPNGEHNIVSYVKRVDAPNGYKGASSSKSVDVSPEILIVLREIRDLLVELSNSHPLVTSERIK